MRTIEFTVDGKPVAKARPRLARGGHTYTPKKTREAEMVIADTFRSLNQEPMEGALSVSITCYFTPPKSWSKKKAGDALMGRLKMTGKTDADNLGKLVCDALNGVAWQDDSQITSITVRKRYAAKGQDRGENFGRCVVNSGRD